MADNDRNPQQQNDQQRRAPGQQQQQGQPRQDGTRQDERGRNPGGQANQLDDSVRRGDR